MRLALVFKASSNCAGETYPKELRNPLIIIPDDPIAYSPAGQLFRVEVGVVDKLRLQ